MRLPRLFGGPSWGSSLIASRDNVTPPMALMGQPYDGGLAWGGTTPASLLGLSAVWRCLDILANGVSQLDWVERRGNLDLPPSRLVGRPQAQRTRREWTSLVVSTLALYDVCYLLKVGEDAEGVPLGLWYLDPTIVAPSQIDTVSLNFLLPPPLFQVAGHVTPREQLVILHRSPQPTIPDYVGGIVNLARTMFGAALAADRYASRYWQAGGSTSEYLTTQSILPKTIRDEMRDDWRQRKAKGPDYAPVMTGGLEVKNLGADPTAAAAVEARREQVADIGRYFGVPTAILNAPAGDTETYNTTEAQGIHLVTYTLRNYIEAIEDAISDQLPGGRHMEMLTGRLTAGSQLARAQAYQLASGGAAWISVEEIREIEGLPPQELPQPAPVPVQQIGVPND